MSRVTGWNEHIAFPAICLVVSGGHTELLLMKRQGSYECVGRTQDDAVGEAFDKVAKLLHLPYPGGPSISRAAVEGDAYLYKLPRPMLAKKNLDFSFAGMKTAVLYTVRGVPGHAPQKTRGAVSIPDMAASFQQAAVDVLVGKTIRAAQQFKVLSVLLAGGVAANMELRKQLVDAVVRELPYATYFQPALEYCTDNAAMIAARGVFAFQKKRAWPWKTVKADPNWETW